MRISTSQFYEGGTNALQRQQQEVADQQQRIASGKRILSPSEDPSASVRTLALASGVDAARQYQRNGDLAGARLATQESILDAVGENLQRVRELTLQAANASQTDATRSDIATEIEQRLGELFDLANTRDAGGEYMFAGFSSGQRPFTRTADGIRYDGDDGARHVAIGDDRQVRMGDSGRDLFMDIAGGNGTFDVGVDPGNTGSGVIETGSVQDPAAYDGDSYRIEFTDAETFDVVDSAGTIVASDQPYTPDAAIDAIPGIEVVIEGRPAGGDAFTVSPAGERDMFAVYQELVDTLRSPGVGAPGSAAQQTGMNRALTGLDSALGHVQDVRTDVGARLSGIDAQRALNEDVIIQLESARSSLEDLDYVEAISRFQQQLTTLEAARSSFSRIQGQSLFDFLR